MPRARCSSWIRYGVAAAAAFVALLLQELLSPFLHDQSPYAVLLLAPLVAGCFGGFGPGLLATAVTALGTDELFQSLRLLSASRFTHDCRLLFFVTEGIVISWLTERLHQARACAEENERRVTSADVRKDEFLATLGHELRNPLATVRHAVAILKDPRAREPQLARARDTLERQADYMTRLIDDILDVSRITRGVLTFEMQRIDLRDAAVRAVEQCRTALDARRHEFTMSLPRHPVWIEADLVRLTQVISNLLVNAAKYTDDGGSISLEIEQADREATISVRDNGMGIGPEMLAVVFDLFTQSDRARSRAQGGLGLGLAVVRSIVERHGGSVLVHSAGSNQGSEFVVRLPLPNEATSDEKKHRTRRGLETLRAMARRNRARQPARTRRILLVDDNVDAANALGTILRLDGHDVRIATTGRMALDMARSQRPEVMLVDLKLPDIDGSEVVRQLCSEWSDRRPAMIALTGYWGEDVRQHCLEAGFHAFLLKPVRHADLAQTIEDCLSPATARSASRLSDASIELSVE